MGCFDYRRNRLHSTMLENELSSLPSLNRDFVISKVAICGCLMQKGKEKHKKLRFDSK